MSINTESLRCPQCHGPMEEGCVPAANGLLWVRGRMIGENAMAEDLPGTHAVMRPNRLEAWRCRKCQLVTFRYGKPLEARGDVQRRQEQIEEGSAGS